MNDIRALHICYRLLSKMDRRVQVASLDWLKQRLEADQSKANAAKRDILKRDRDEFKSVVGDAALSLVTLLDVTGGSSGKRDIEIRGPINADVVVSVRKA